MSTELTAQRAGELYASGQSVIEVAREYNMTYGSRLTCLPGSRNCETSYGLPYSRWFQGSSPWPPRY